MNRFFFVFSYLFFGFRLLFHEIQHTTAGVASLTVALILQKRAKEVAEASSLSNIPMTFVGGSVISSTRLYFQQLMLFVFHMFRNDIHYANCFIVC